MKSPRLSLSLFPGVLRGGGPLPGARLRGLACAAMLCVPWCPLVHAGDPAATLPATDPASPHMLAADAASPGAAAINPASLRRLAAERAVVSDVRAAGGVNQHVYLARYLNRFWVMWSDGPGLEDRAGQRVKFAMSEDGASWSEPAHITPEPPFSGPTSPHYNTRSLQGFRWIARGFWVRRGELLALASLDEAGDSAGPSLQLRAFRIDPKTDEWKEAAVIGTGLVDDLPPQQLPGGAWMMACRRPAGPAPAFQYLIGGEESLDRWEPVSVPGSAESALDQPLWWALPDGRLVSVGFGGSKAGQLFRSCSADGGRTWIPPVRTNFPAAPGRIHGTRLADGRYVLVSQIEAAGERPLVLSVSPDGLVFRGMFRLTGKERVGSPFVLEHQGQLLIALSTEKQAVEVLRVRLADLAPAPDTATTARP